MIRESAIAWLRDLDFTDDIELGALEARSDSALASMIEDLYAGGVYQFIMDGEENDID